MTYSYLVEQQVQRAIAHKLCNDAEELGLVADAKDLDDVVESGFVEHLCLLQQAVPLSKTQPVIHSQPFNLRQSVRNVRTVTAFVVLFSAQSYGKNSKGSVGG